MTLLTSVISFLSGGGECCYSTVDINLLKEESISSYEDLNALLSWDREIRENAMTAGATSSPFYILTARRLIRSIRRPLTMTLNESL